LETFEKIDRWRGSFDEWKGTHGRDLVRGELDDDYPFVSNRHASLVPVRRALPLINLALISSAGAYLDGTESFDRTTAGGDMTMREIPTEIDAEDLLYSARGYDATAVRRDMNTQIPLTRLAEFSANGIIGSLAPVFFSFCGFIPDAATFTEQTLPRMVERVRRYEVQAALLIPASRLCHQSIALAARALEAAGVPTMMLAVKRDILDETRPPRAVYHNGELGSVVGAAGFEEYQRRVLDEALRAMETWDQPGVRKLTVKLESEVEEQRGER